MSSKYHVNPRIRAYGKARIDVTLRASNEQEWQSMWRSPLNPFPFTWADDWAFCFEYQVDDFAAEVGFYIDILGFDVRAFSPSYAQFTDPDNIYCLSVMAVPEGVQSTDPDSVRLQLKVHDIDQTTAQLEKRGIIFEQKPMAIHEGSPLKMGYFRTPHGVCIDLFGEVIIDTDDDEYPREDEVDEEEADRLIEEILGLSDDQDDFEDDGEDDATEADYALAGLVDEEDDTEIPPARASQANRNSHAENFGNNVLPEPARNANQPISAGNTRSNGRDARNGSFVWPSQNDQKIKEPTYHAIEDDTGSTEEV